ncbi:hypothetical protein ACFQ5D_12715 [Paenibacillus farraposensis]|uniref:Uncharacterized protein n=2 Tax=Paenibacillus farraposensis TaxID=2807095 RepID=A0ABW4DEP7_9BACL|nr:hypothetical protein [Paenibacillus farraposensis]
MQKIDPVTQRPQLDAQGKEVTEKVEMLTGFKPVNVFDVSQTKGKELANLRAIIRDDIKDNHRAAELYSSLSNHIGKKWILEKVRTTLRISLKFVDIMTA